MRAWLAALLSVLLAGALLHWLRQEAERVVRARVWRPSQPGFEFPELAKGSALRDYLMKREDFAIAVAGGGNRGMSIAHGAVRTLRKAGILDKARYLSTTSGSVWFGVPFYYQSGESIDALLGESLPPEELTPEVITSDRLGTFFGRLSFFGRYPKGVHGSGEEASGQSRGDAALRGAPHVSVEVEAERTRRREAEAQWGLKSGTLDGIFDCLQGMDICGCLTDHLLPDSSARELWSLVTNYIFLQPFGLAGPFSSHCHETQLEHARKRLGNASTIYVARDMSQNLPFLISQSAVLAPYSGYGRPVAAFPLEQTPLYVGTPSSYAGENAYPYAGVGDALVEAFAWPGSPEEPVPEAPVSEVKIRQQPHLFNMGQLAEWAAIATSYAADFQVRAWTANISQCIVGLYETLMPHALVWSPLGVVDRGVPVAQEMAVGDAGIYDDLGHLPLLRRGIRKMVIYDTSAVHDNETGFDREDLCEMVYTRAAFGQPGCVHPTSAPGAPNPEMAAGFNTVFEPSEFRPWWEKVKALYKAEKPVVLRSKFTVVDNVHLGIKGGYQVEIVWIVGLPIKAWRSKLPKETSKGLRSFFPNYLAAEIRSRLEMSALSQYASWITEREVIKEVRAMLGEDSTEAAGAHLETEVAV